MKVKDTGNSVEFEPAPIGMHVARCVRMIDLGTRHDDFYNKDKHELFIMWELPNEIKNYTIKGKDGEPDRDVSEPFTVSKFYTASLSDKAHLRNDLESWRSRAFTEDELAGFEMKNILGAPCMVNVIHSPKKKGDGINVVVKSVGSMVKGMTCPEATHDLVYFSLDEGEFDQEVFDNLSQGLQRRVMDSNEYKALKGNQPVQDSVQVESENPAPAGAPEPEFDDIPF